MTTPKQWIRALTLAIVAALAFSHAYDAQAKWHPREKTGREPANQPGSQHQLVADDFGL